ncbi:hypothetical protein JNW87_31070, partial [Micromonospora sp. ATA51]|nr:hypothetical protein [Micromonospora sp. ATA51]
MPFEQQVGEGGGPAGRVKVRGEAADHLFGQHRPPGDHAVPFEQQVGEGGGPA